MQAPDDPQRAHEQAGALDPAAPTSPEERFARVDAVRGLALLGILLVNMAQFSQPIDRLLAPLGDHGPADQLVAQLVRFLAEGKFYPLFSLLFGLGLVLQMSRAEARGEPGAWKGRWVRRQLVLLAFGLVHGVFIWDGDVLAVYALLGLLALRFRATSERRLIGWFIGLTLVLALLVEALAGLASLVPDPGPDGSFAEDMAREARLYGAGAYLEVVRFRVGELWQTILLWAFLSPSVLAMFVLGIWMGRRGALADPAAHRPLWRRLLALGLAVGLPANVASLLFYRTLGGESALSMADLANVLHATATSLVAGPALALAYLSIVALASARESAERWLRVLAPAGQMALTNYLLQSAICTTLFYGYGLGLFGKLGAAATAVLAVAIFAVEVVVSRWWLARYRFGPSEWLWRTLTYGRGQPLRR
jgi:uncharacterized protein